MLSVILAQYTHDVGVRAWRTRAQQRAVQQARQWWRSAQDEATRAQRLRHTGTSVSSGYVSEYSGDVSEYSGDVSE